MAIDFGYTNVDAVVVVVVVVASETRASIKNHLADSLWGSRGRGGGAGGGRGGIKEANRGVRRDGGRKAWKETRRRGRGRWVR